MFETGGGALPENFYTSKEKIRHRKGKIFKIQNHKNPILCVCVWGGGQTYSGFTFTFYFIIITPIYYMLPKK